MPEEKGGYGRFARLRETATRAFVRLVAALAAGLGEARAAASDRSFHVEAAAYVYALNCVLMVFIGRHYLQYIDESTSFAGWVATLLAYVSNFAALCLLPAALAALAGMAARRWWVSLVVVPCLFTILNGFLYADGVVYGLFRRHLTDGLVLNVMFTPGAGDSVTAGWSTVLSGLRIVLSIAAAELGFSLCLYPYLRRLGFARRLRTRRALALVLAAVVALVAADKAVYAAADLADRSHAMQSGGLFPLYVRVTVKRFARNWLGMDISTGRKVGLETVTGSMDYPAAPIAFDPSGARPNVVVAVIEGGRFDALDAEVMPFLSDWGARNLVFEEHYSAGNCSRFGTFGLLYGIHGTYWDRVLADRRGPVLIRELGRLGYEFRILSCTDLNFPEFRKTAFVDVPDAITDAWECERLGRDRAMTDEFLRFLGARDGERPFFAFLFYDASHQPYLYPPEHAVFKTDARPADLDYVKVAKDLRLALPFRERFRNSLHYIDSELGRAIGALEERAIAEETLVFVTGDHGEEFCELGLFGHNTTFHRYQAKTVMVAHVPGGGPRRVRRLTSHVDLVPTILGHLGVKNPPSDYTHGTPLTSAEGPEYVVVAGWGDAALVDKDAITYFGIPTRVLDHDYRELPDQSAEKAKRAKWYADVLRSQRRFVK